MSEVEKQNYISLQEATKFCEYSQEYLSLRARQGRLRAQKQGRNWLTTEEWLLKYINSAQVYKNGLEEKRNGNGKNKEVKTITQTVRELPAPPSNLPIAETVQPEDIVEKALPELVPGFVLPRLGKFVPVVPVFAIAILVLGSSFYLFANNSSLFKSEQQIASLSEDIQQLPVNLGKFFLQIASEVRSRFSYIEDRFAQFRFAAERKKGLVVIPSTDSDELVKKQIRDSFSDEVSILPHDDESGIITPIFRERIGDDYLYLLVPVNDEP